MESTSRQVRTTDNNGINNTPKMKFGIQTVDWPERSDLNINLKMNKMGSILIKQ